MQDLSSIEIILLMYQRNNLREYLKLLSDDELNDAFNSVKYEDVLEIIREEKAYRYYSNMLNALKEGKSK